MGIVLSPWISRGIDLGVVSERGESAAKKIYDFHEVACSPGLVILRDLSRLCCGRQDIFSIWNYLFSRVFFSIWKTVVRVDSFELSSSLKHDHFTYSVD